MSDLKALRKLAEACRKAGIKHYKNDEVEFTLTDELPISNYKKRTSKSVYNDDQTAMETLGTGDSLTDEQMLLWSATPIATSEDTPSDQ